MTSPESCDFIPGQLSSTARALAADALPAPTTMTRPRAMPAASARNSGMRRDGECLTQPAEPGLGGCGRLVFAADPAGVTERVEMAEQPRIMDLAGSRL